MKTETNALRSMARQSVVANVAYAAELSHSRNYHKLYVRRDGEVHWTECINKSDDIIDDKADRFAPVPSVTCVGTGSAACNCQYCDEVYHADDEARAIEAGREYDKDAKYASQHDAVLDAIGDSDPAPIEDGMLAEFDATIPIGYFNDEEAGPAL